MLFLFEVSVIASLIHQSCGRQMQRERIPGSFLIKIYLNTIIAKKFKH